MNQNLAGIENPDVVQLMVKLQVEQAAYEAALAATDRAIVPSLTEFLR